MNLKKHSTAFILPSLLTPVFSVSALADSLPEGVQLASEQILVRANDAELQRLIRLKRKACRKCTYFEIYSKAW